MITHRQDPAVFWGGLIFLNILLFVPFFILQTRESSLIPIPPLNGPRGWYDTLLFFVRRENQDFFRLSADLYLLTIILALMSNNRWKAKGDALAVIVYLFLLVYQTYEALTLKIFGQHPVLYSDLLLIKDGAYLVFDLWSSRLIDTVLRILVWTAGIIWMIRYAFTAASHGVRRLRSSMPVLVGAAATGVFILFSTFWYSTWIGFLDYRPVVQWVVPKVVENMRECLRGFMALRQADDAVVEYARYQGLQFDRKPNIYLILVESYGRAVAEIPELESAYNDLMEEVEKTLGAGGWFSTSNYSTAGISGGKSWLSVASVLTGMDVSNQPIYEFLIHRRPEYPHFVRFLNQQGYHTLALQPPMRKRPGFSFGPYQQFYRFDRWIYFQDLNYSGDFYGWGMIPDQYSLNYTREKYLSNHEQPYFLLFSTVTSHAPWYDLPPLAEDWRTLNQPGGVDSAHARYRALDSIRPRTQRRLITHLKRQLGIKDLFRINNYFSQIEYQIRVLQDYIVEQSPFNSVFVIVGDHQPPVITSDGGGFETPIHVISQDETFIESFHPYGFVQGMKKDAHSGGYIRHEAIFSMLVRTLAQRYGTMRAEQWPPYLPEGVSLSALRN